MKLRIGFVLFLVSVVLSAQETERFIKLEVEVNTPISNVYTAWTTEEGVKTFFAQACKVELQPNGAYEMYFAPDAPEGSKGGEGNKILAFEENKMISFSWNAPPSLPTVREQRTSVVVRFFPLDNNKTKVTLFHSGWGEGEEWDKAFEYFSYAWGKIVLPRLKYRFEHGPVDWNNPPEL